MTRFQRILATYPEDSPEYQKAKSIIFWQKKEDLWNRLLENMPLEVTQAPLSHAIESGRHYVPLTIKSLLLELLP